jgi:hypothetical protein
VQLPRECGLTDGLFYVPQAFFHLAMPRARGIGMARPKKRKVEAVEQVTQDMVEEPPPPEPPAPPSTPPKKVTVVAPQSPSQTLLLKAQRRARLFVDTAKKRTHEKMERANGLLEAEYKKFEAVTKALERAEAAKLKPSPSGQLQKAHKAEIALERARYSHLVAKYDAALDLVSVCEAEIAAKDASENRSSRASAACGQACKAVQKGVEHHAGQVQSLRVILSVLDSSDMSTFRFRTAFYTNLTLKKTVRGPIVEVTPLIPSPSHGRRASRATRAGTPPPSPASEEPPDGA